MNFKKEGDILQPVPLEKSGSENELLPFGSNTGSQGRKRRENGSVRERDGFAPDPQGISHTPESH